MTEEAHPEEYMRRAIALATLGLGKTSPNPLVGCVLVKNGRIIGEGYHKKYGEAHAEVNAVLSVKESSQIAGSTAYVTLEPCSHHGKTPPCTDLLIRHQVGKVVIGNLDPFEKVNGAGEKRLRDHGIEVETGMLADECRWMNRRFLTNQAYKRPYVILKWAETQDGFIARENFDSKWISNSQSRQLVHKWRAEEDAILVGKNTAINDDPSLTVRDWQGENPTRVLIDINLQVATKGNLWKDESSTLIFNGILDKKEGKHEWIKINPDHYETQVLQHLNTRKISSLIIEGGAKTLQGFIEKELWDEARIFKSLQQFGKGIDAPTITGNLLETKSVEQDKLEILLRN